LATLIGFSRLYQLLTMAFSREDLPRWTESGIVSASQRTSIRVGVLSADFAGIGSATN